MSHKWSTWVSQNKECFPILNQLSVVFSESPPYFFLNTKTTVGAVPPLLNTADTCLWGTLICTAKSCLGPFRLWVEVCLTFYQDLEIAAESPIYSLGKSSLLCSPWLCSATVKEQTGSAIHQSLRLCLICHQQGTVEQWWAKNPAHGIGQFPKHSFIWGKIAQLVNSPTVSFISALSPLLIKHVRVPAL